MFENKSHKISVKDQSSTSAKSIKSVNKFYQNRFRFNTYCDIVFSCTLGAVCNSANTTLSQNFVWFIQCQAEVRKGLGVGETKWLQSKARVQM